MLTVELFRRECNTNVVALFAGSEKNFLSSVITIRKCKYQISPEYSFQSCNELSAAYIRCDIAICWENTLHLPSYLYVITYHNHIIWRLAAHLYAICWGILNIIHICKQQLLHLCYSYISQYFIATGHDVDTWRDRSETAKCVQFYRYTPIRNVIGG